MNQDKRDVVLACDHNVLNQAVVTVYSLVSNLTQPNLYRLTFVYFGDLDEANVALTGVVPPDIELRVVPGLSTYANTPTCSKLLTTPTFARMELSKYVQADCTRALWLDTDTVVVDDLGELFTMPLTTPIAAVRARVAIEDGKFVREMFNNGVMVVDMNTWKNADVEAKCFQRSVTNPRQCDIIMNIVLMRQCTYISSVFNYLQCNMRCPLHEFNRLTLDGRTDVRVVHYQGGRKPWKYPRIPFAELWHMYAARHVDKNKQAELLALATGR